MQNAEYVDVTPGTDLLNQLFHLNLTWAKSLGELTDNAFDAGSNTVQILFGPRRNKLPEYITIKDDGSGCAKLEAMLRLGCHEHLKSTQSGRFGIGGKEALAWIGGRHAKITITSTKGGVTRVLRFDWESLAKNNWRMPRADHFSEHAARPGEQGTEIVIRPVVRRIPGSGSPWKEFIQELGYLYAPALKRGGQISIRNNPSSASEPIIGYTLPELEGDIIQQTIHVAGRSAAVHAGIVRDYGNNKYRGLTYVQGFRVIQKASGKGCGTYDVSRIAGIVTLIDKSPEVRWPLNKNKDGINALEDELYEAVLATMRPLLERAASIGHTIESSEFLSVVEAHLNSGLNVGGPRDSRGVRNRGNKSGSVKPTGEGSGHKKAMTTQPGDTFASGCRGGIKVHINPFPEDDERIGYFDPAGAVYLSRLHPWVAAAEAERNALALAAISLSLCIHAETVSPGGQRLLKFNRSSSVGDSEDQFNLAMGRLLRGVTHNGVPLSLVKKDTQVAA